MQRKLTINKNMKTLRIKEILAEKRMTQKDLAKRMGITEVALSRLISRDRPDFDSLERMADGLGVRMAELFSDYTPNTMLVCPHCGANIKIETKEG